MAYEVTENFKDRINGTQYQVGDEYPKGDNKPTKERIEELLNHPKHKRAFIKEVEDVKSVLDLNANEAIDKINNGEFSKEQLQELLNSEKEGKKRKTVIAEIESETNDLEESPTKE